MENARVSDGKPDIFLKSQYKEIQNILGMRNFAKLCKTGIYRLINSQKL